MSNLVRLCCALAAASLLAFAYAPTASLSRARATASAAASITVNSTADFAADDGQCTLREALNSAANDAPSGASPGECAAGSGADTININVTGTINLTDMLSTTTNVSIVGPGSALLTLRSTGSPHRVFFANVSTVNISGLTITNGAVTDGGGSGGGLINGGTMTLTDVVVTGNRSGNGFVGAPGGGSGGGIYNAGVLTLVNCVVSGNTSGSGVVGTNENGAGGRGGGIDSGSGVLTLINSVVSGNSTGGGPGGGGPGGGIFTGNSATLTDSTVSGNSTGAGGSGGAPGGDGGGIYNSGTLTLTGSTVSGNSTGKGAAGGPMGGSGGKGGGIYTQSGTATLTRSTVSSNSTGDGDFTDSHNGGGGGGLGGGIYNRSGTLKLSDSTVSGNSTGKDVFGNRSFGGGIGNVFGDLTITGSVLSGNTGANGSAVATSSGPVSPKLTNTTISGNSASAAIEARDNAAVRLTNCTITANPDGGVGIFSAAPPVVGNTIIALNGPSETGPDVTGSFSSQGHNLIGNGDGGTGFNSLGDLVGTTAAPVNPRLGPLASNGGPTLTHALLSASPALDAGDNALAKDANNNTLATDQRGAGFPRFADSADADATQTVDIGAYEAHPAVEDIADKSMFSDTTLSFNFKVGDAAIGLTSVAASSSNASLVPNDPAHISVSGTGSQRTLNVTPAAGANTPANGTASITVTATASNGRTASDTFVLTVFVNHAPTALDLSNTTVADNSHGTTAVGTFSTTHPDAGETFTYALVPGAGDTDNAFFFINGSTLTGANFDFETKPVYAARVRSTDSNGDFIERAFLITVTDGPDSTGSISFTASDFSVSESGGPATIRLARTGGSDNRVVAKINLSNVTTSAADYDFAPGSLDASFNPGGEGASSHSSALPQYVAALAYQVDGKAVVGGAFLFYNGLQRGRLARVESDGSLDTSFDSGVGANGPVNAIVLQPDGKVIIAGAFTSYNNVSRNRIARLNDDGTLDTTFNTSGPNGNLYVLAMQPDGKILVGGTFNSFGGSSARRQIVRLNSDGSLDPGFNPVGTNSAGVDTDAVRAIAPQPDGKILVGGGFVEFSGVTNTRILRLNSNGSVDNTFTPSIGISMAVRDIIQQPDGKSVVVGEFIGNDTPYGKRGVVRLNTDGTVDPTFDPGAGTNGGTVESVALQPDGKLVVGGWFTSYNGTNINRLARLNTNGSLDTSFNPGDGANSPVRDVLVQPSGRVLVGGQQTFYNNTSSNGLTRVRGDLFVTWNPGETFNRAILLPIVDDSLAEANETLMLTLTTFGAPAGEPATSTLTINDNETSVSSVSGSGSYSGTATLTATLTSGGSPLPGKTITLTLGGTTGSATTNASGVATFAGATLQGLPAGSYPNLVGASFAGDPSYTASSGTGALTVNKADTTTTVNVSDAAYDGNPHGATAKVTGPGGLNQSLPVTYTGKAPYGPTAAAPTHAGDYTADALYPGDSNYNASSDSKDYKITRIAQTITFDALANKTFGDADFTVSAAATSGGTVSFSATGNCSLAFPATVHIAGAGSCTITAEQPGGGDYNAAPNVSRSFNVAKAGSTTTVTSSQNPSAFGQSVTFTATVASGAGTPTGAVQFEVDGANVGGPVTLGGGVATFTTSSLSVGAHGVTARYGGDPNFEASAANLAAGQEVGSFIEFSQPSYSVNEGASLTVTVRRTGDTTQEASVDYATDDGSTPSVVVPCSVTTGIALDRCDYTKAIGTLRFAAGEAEKTFVVLGGDDSYAEGPETAVLKLSNPSAGSALVLNSTALFTINDDSPESTGNPSDDDAKFVTQHYRDFLNRDPDAAGLAFWKGQITSCGSDSACRDVRRINVSAAFFLSIEFQETGYLVYRAYKTAYGDATSPNVAGTVPVIRIDEFLPDTQRIGQGVVVGVGNWQQTLEANKQDYFAAFVARARFANAYATTLSPAQFVNNLFLNAGVTPTTAERNAAVAEFGAATNTSNQAARGRALRRVAEHPALAEAEKNRAFVLMEYYGYLRRNPNDAPEPTLNFAGWKFWLTKLEQFNGNFVAAEMVKAFISSDEYRHRFGQ